MPIDFFEAADGLHVRQSFVSPTVYLDHWAIRLFSDDLVLQNRFVNSLHSKGGTLLLSTFSFSEFARSTDSRHSRDAEAFLDRLLPNIFLTDFAWDRVLDQENTEVNNARRFWPSADLPQLKLLGEHAEGSVSGLTMRGFVALAHTYGANISKLTDAVVQSIKDKLERSRNDPQYVSKARNSVPNDKRPRTFVIMAELMRGFILDHSAPISDNDVVDFIHAAMPVNCCDFVLLDSAWVERVEKMRQRISKAATPFPIAKCYSKKGNQIEMFLADLEAFNDPA